jgi:serine/threonine protein kinase/Tol biopolymer transport system component
MTDSRTHLATALADHYRIQRELGQGGMATVYLAEDLKHDRKVAIKVLRPELSAVIGAKRFIREIKTIANLQHPHILGLIDSGEVNGTAYYVMPFVEGESLRDRLTREKQLPIADAVRIATEVASALDYAHRHNVIHRDIKPENIMLHDGSALVADFGIALAVSTAGGSTRMTETGMSLGTPHYMSPEQAMGEREITARSDVYSLGAMTYEMLAGDPPFTGSTAQAIVAQVLTEDPRPLTVRRRSVPPEVEAAVLTALEKLPADRFGSAQEFAAALGGSVATRTPRSRARSSAAGASSWRNRLALAAGAFVIALAAYSLGARRSRPSGPPLSFGQSIKVTWDPGLEVLPAISPDGKTVAYASGSPVRMRVFARPVAGGRGISLTDDTTQIQSHPRWSPDGSRVLFLERGGVASVPASGGVEKPEVPRGRNGPVVSATWSPDGTRIAYVVGDSLFIRDARGESRGIARVFEGNGCVWSPDGADVACSSGNAISLTVGTLFGNVSPSKIVTVRVSDGRVVPITDSLSLNQSPVWSPDGSWLYYVSNRYGPRDIFAQRISAGSPEGPALRLTTGLNAHTVSLSGDGRRLAYASIDIESNAWSMPIPAHPPGSVSSSIQLTHGSQYIEAVVPSEDGRWLYYDSDMSGNMDIYRMALPGGVPERLTTDSSDDFFPDPSPDGREVAFHSWRGGSRDIWVMPLDGGPLQRVTSSPAQEAIPHWSPDGSRIAYSIFTARGAIWTVRRVNGVWQQPVERLDHGSFPMWSPDGRSISFTTALAEGSLWVMPADSGPPRLIADTVGPGATRGDGVGWWTADGHSIITRGHDAEGRATFWSIPVGGGPPQLLFTFDGNGPAPSRGAWGLYQNRIVYPAAEQRSDVWVMEVKAP